MDKPDRSRADQWLQAAASSTLSCLIARLDPPIGSTAVLLDRHPGESAGSPSLLLGQHGHRRALCRQLRLGGSLLVGAITVTKKSGSAPTFSNGRAGPTASSGTGGRSSHPNAEMSKYAPDAGVLTAQRHVDMFCQRSPLLAMTSMLAMGDESVTPRIRQIIQQYAALPNRTATSGGSPPTAGRPSCALPGYRVNPCRSAGLATAMRCSRGWHAMSS